MSKRKHGAGPKKNNPFNENKKNRYEQKTWHRQEKLKEVL